MTQATKTLYEADFVQWSDRTAQLLREHRFADLDLDHLIEEVEDLGNRHRDALESQLTQLFMHLLKYEFRPEQRSGSWLGSIKEYRKQLKRLCRRYPSLKPYLEQCWEDCYADAIEDASDETGLPQSQFPERCPYALSEVLNPEVLPD
jgi:Domain of unknown function DUF29